MEKETDPITIKQPGLFFVALDLMEHVVEGEIIILSPDEPFVGEAIGLPAQSAPYDIFRKFVEHTLRREKLRDVPSSHITFHLYSIDNLNILPPFKNRYNEEYIEHIFMPWTEKNKYPPRVCFTGKQYETLNYYLLKNQKESIHFRACNFDKLPTYLLNSKLNVDHNTLVNLLASKIIDTYNTTGGLPAVLNAKEVSFYLKTTEIYKPIYEEQLKNIYAINEFHPFHIILCALKSDFLTFGELLALYKIADPSVSWNIKTDFIRKYGNYEEVTKRQIDLFADQLHNYSINENAGLYDGYFMIMDAFRHTEYFKNSVTKESNSHRPIDLLLFTEEIFRSTQIIEASKLLPESQLKNHLYEAGKNMWFEKTVKRITIEMHFLKEVYTADNSLQYCRNRTLVIIEDLSFFSVFAPPSCKELLDKLEETLFKISHTGKYPQTKDPKLLWADITKVLDSNAQKQNINKNLDHYLQAPNLSKVIPQKPLKK